MPLPLPNLDDRRWTDLTEEGRALIPRYARQWTDHNVSDPGITLIELFAWLTESSVYGLNRVTARHREKFLSLIGFAPRPPLASQSLLALRPAPGSASFLLPAGIEFVTRTPDRTVVPWRTLRPITISDVRLAAVQVDEGAGVEDRTVEWKNGLSVRVFGTDPQPGAAFYLGFEAIPPQKPVSLALRWSRPGSDAAGRATESLDERARLIAERAARDRACRTPLPDIQCPGSQPPASPSRLAPPHHSARVVWEVFTGIWTPLVAVDPPGTPAEGQVADDTRSVTLDGSVDMNLPVAIVKLAVGGVPASLFYVRCRLAQGAYDSPPMLLDTAINAVPVEQSVPLTQRFTIPAPVTPTGTSATVPTPGKTMRFRMKLAPTQVVQALAFDPTAASLPDVLVLDYKKVGGTEGHLTLALVCVGRGNGLPDQTFAFPEQAVATDDALSVWSHDGASWQEWTLRASFDASRRTDFHYTLDATRGVVVFGNGERGRVLPRDHFAFVTARVTAGGAATITAGSTVQVRQSAVNDLLLKSVPVPLNLLAAMTTAVWPAAGGADQETLAHASGRAADVLHAHERLVDLADSARTSTLDQIDPARVRELPVPTNAVNALDLERIALDVPGTRVARARAWPGVHPRFSCLSASGWITLVVVPDMPVDQPQPSSGLLRSLTQYLGRRRMVTTVLRVVGPTYLAVSVSATISLRRGAGNAATRAQIERALDRFLHPLTGGPDGLGWPFGRAIYRSEILQLIDDVAGVDHVLDLSLSAAGGVPQCGNLTLCPTWLASSGPHDIRIG
jgi:hypothetical protein